jgi:putative FmdB family regulatory protein
LHLHFDDAVSYLASFGLVCGKIPIMPIYEYWCAACGRKATIYQPKYTSALPPCPYCGSNQLRRMLSAFSMRKTYKDIYEDILSDRELTGGMLGNDPRALAEWNRRMSGGEKVAPEYEEIMERMERGELPAEQIKEKSRQLTGQEGEAERS